MISVSSNELGLGFGGIGEEEEEVMEESDFDEESTHSYVSCVDPDLALSYIDEKLENVLGHFQKDFEGGVVSAENLGAKFGGYGSFLSMYQRSPVCSSTPKSPLEAQNQMGVRLNGSVVVPEVSVSGSALKAPASASDVLVKLKKFVKSSTPDNKSQKPVTKNSSSCSAPSSNHKTLKLRIKVGSGDLSSLKNSKEGLKMPQSEVEEGLLYGSGDSPTKIIMAMVSFPLHKDQLLSPLSDDLIQLGKKEKIGCVSSVNISDSKGIVKKENLKERVKSMPQYGNRIASNTEKESEKVSSEEIVSTTLKLPVLSPSCIQPTKEIDKVSNTYVDEALMGSKTEVEDNVAAFPDRSVKEIEKNNKRKDVNQTEGETRSSLESKSKWEKAPRIERVDKVSQSETKNEEQNLKSKLPKAQKSQKSSSRNSLRGKDATVNIVNKNVPDKLQEDIGRTEDVYKEFFGDLGESKEEKLISSTVLKAAENDEKVSEENALKESIKSVKNDEDACNLVCEPDSKHLIKSSELNEEDKHKTKQSVKREVTTNKLSVEGGTENIGMEPDRELSGTCKKPKTGKSRFSAVESNKVPEIEASSAQKVKDIGKASSHDDRKRKLKETKENGDCTRVREEAVVVMEEASGEKARKKKRVKGSSSCDRKELPFSSERCDKDNGEKDSAFHLPLTAPSPSLCKDLGNEAKSSGRISEKGEHHDGVDGDTLKRRRDGEGYNSNIDKPGKTTKKATEISKDDHNDLVITGQATRHSWDKERANGENGSIEKHKPKKSERYSESESQGKNKEENNRSTKVNEVQEDLGSSVEVKTKESGDKKRPARKVSVESNKEDSKDHQDPNSKTSRGKSNNHMEATVEKSKNKSDQVKVLGHDSEISDTKKQITRNDNNGVDSRSQKQNGNRPHKDLVGLSPLKKETSTSQAASNSIKEATNLKHMADRLKNGGSNHESTSVYFQAALKFLHGASLLESSSSNAKSRHIYGSTAKLCEFCAHEYEKNKDMGAAALAYKCMEVAYLRITYSSHGNVTRYRHELQAALQLIPPSGGSPSFVSSDGEKSNTVRSSSSPLVTGNNHVISSGNNSSVSHLLTFSQNVSYAMDASRKAQTAFATAKGKKPFDNRYSTDGITSIKRALDFSFQDMEKLLHLVRLAMELINR